MSDETVMKHAEAMADALGDESWRSWTQEQAGEVEAVLDSLRRIVRDRDDGCCISFPPASSPAHGPVTCTCCQIALAATRERDAREAGHGEAFATLLDRLVHAEQRASIPWSFCPACGIDAPRPGRHHYECPLAGKGP